MKKIIFPKYDLSRIFISIFFIPSLAQLFNIFIVLAKNKNVFRITEGYEYLAVYSGIAYPLSVFFFALLAMNVFQAFEYIVLSPEEIRVYNFFIPTAVIKLNAPISIEINYTVNAFGKKNYKFFSVYGDGKNVKKLRVLSVGIDAFVRICRKKIYAESLEMLYDENYVHAIETFYEIESTLNGNDPYIRR